MTVTSVIIIVGILFVNIFLVKGYRNSKFRGQIEGMGAYFSFATTIISLMIAVLFGISAENLTQISNDFSKRSMPLEIDRKVELTQEKVNVSNESSDYTYNFKVTKEIVEGNLFLEYIIFYPINSEKTDPSNFEVNKTTNDKVIEGSYFIDTSPAPFNFFILTIDSNRNMELKYYHIISPPFVTGTIDSSTKMGSTQINDPTNIYNNYWNASDLFDEELVNQINKVIREKVSFEGDEKDSPYFTNRDDFIQKYEKIKQFSDKLIY